MEKQKKPPMQQKQELLFLLELIKGSKHIISENGERNLQAEYNKSKADDLTPEQWETFYNETKEAVNNFEDKLN